MDHRYKKLLVLVDSGSYSAAAKHLRISQPAMTISIASLEKSLGKKLIAQKKPNILLTEAGEIVYKASKNLQKEIDLMRNALDTAASSPLHVGFIDSIAHLIYNTPRDNIILKDIEVMVDNSRRIINDLMSNQIDFGFITGQPNSLPSAFRVNKLNDEPFVFVGKPSMVKDSKCNNIDDWLAFNRASTSYHHFTKLFKNNNLTVNPIFFSTSLELLKDMAAAGNGTALLPKHFVEKDVASGALKILNTPELHRPIWVVSKNDYKPTRLNSLKTHVDQLLKEA